MTSATDANYCAIAHELLLILILVCALAATTPLAPADPCEDLWDSVDPCTCAPFGVLDCSAVSSGTDLLLIPGLQNGQSLGFSIIRIAGNDRIEEITSGAFGNHYATVSYSFMGNPMLKYISGRVFSPLGADTVGWIWVNRNSLLDSFPFDAIKAYKNLNPLYLWENAIQDVPPHALDGASTILKTVYLGSNQLTSIGTHAFDNLASVSIIDLSLNQLTSLASRSFWFSEDARRRGVQIILYANKIVDFQPEFTNLLAGIVRLGGNNVEFLERSTWEPILTNIIAEDEHVLFYLLDNPIVCDCRMKWLYDHKEFEILFSALNGAPSMLCANMDGLPALWELNETVFSNC